MTALVALGRDAKWHLGYRVDNTGVVVTARGATLDDVLQDLDADDAPVIRIGQGKAQTLPAPVLPNEGQDVPALVQTAPADVISGWVRLWVAGYLADHSNWDGVICAQHGDVVHWLHISADEVVSSASSLTPRMFSAMGLSMTAPDDNSMADTLSRPERLMTHLRAAEINGDAAAALGHLIGADLAATKAYWLGQEAVVIGEGALAEGYVTGLGGQGVLVAQVPVEATLGKGLVTLRGALDA